MKQKFNTNKRGGNKRRVSASFAEKLPQNSVIIYGKHSVFSAIDAKKRKLHKLFLTNKGKILVDSRINSENYKLPKNLDVKVISEEEMGNIVGQDAAHQGFALIASKIARMSLNHFFENKVKDGVLPSLLILDQITDPHNFGAIVRSASAFGFNNIILTERNAPAETSAANKVAVGTMENINIIEVTNTTETILELKEKGYWCVGLDGQGDKSITDLDIDNLALVVGSEDKGIRHRVKKNCDILAKIPMSENVESLNASVAAAIAMYELSLK